MKIFEKLINLFITKSSDEMKEDFLKNNTYPEIDKIFIDKRGNISAIIGTNTLKKGIKVIN